MSCESLSDVIALLPARKNPSEFDLVNVRFCTCFTGLLPAGLAKNEALNLLSIGNDEITLLRDWGVKGTDEDGSGGSGGIEFVELTD